MYKMAIISSHNPFYKDLIWFIGQNPHNLTLFQKCHKIKFKNIIVSLILLDKQSNGCSYGASTHIVKLFPYSDGLWAWGLWKVFKWRRIHEAGALKELAVLAERWIRKLALAFCLSLFHVRTQRWQPSTDPNYIVTLTLDSQMSLCCVYDLVSDSLLGCSKLSDSDVHTLFKGKE